MKAGGPVVTLDACVLYPAPVRDLLLSLAAEGLFRPRWSDRINDEWTRNLLANRPDLDADRLQKTVSAMNKAFLEARTEGIHELFSTIDLPDPNDIHVIACAVKSESTFLVTNNLKDFPPEYCYKNWGIQVLSMDDFVLSLILSSQEKVMEAFESMVKRLKNPPKTAEEVLSMVSGLGLQNAAVRLRSLLADND